MRLAAPAHIVDIGSIPNLASVTSSEDEGVRFQALATHSVLAADEGARRVQPLLNRALQLVAHPTIRNRGTSVGSIVHADPSAEMPAVLTLLGGSVTVQSVRGTREIASTDLFAGPLESSLESDEIAVSVSVPAAEPGVGTAIDEIARRHGDYALVGVVARIRVVDGLVTEAHMTYVPPESWGRSWTTRTYWRGRPRRISGTRGGAPSGNAPRADRYRGRHSRDGGVPLAVGVRAHGAGRFAAATDALSENAVLAGKW